MPPPARRRHQANPGFTLVEILVATAILAGILVLMLQITDRTTAVWKHTRSQIDTFQESRAAFESLTRRLSQAMLKTYFDYDPPISQGTPTSYVRQSELQFICGPASAASGTPGLLSGITTPDGNSLQTVSHAAFFQGPFGVTSTSGTTSNGTTSKLDNLLNVCGYFIQFGDDAKMRPAFLKDLTTVPPRNRFRLMEMLQPSEDFSVYTASNTDWFVKPLGTQNCAHTLAENVIALVLLPKRSPNDPPPAGAPADLAPYWSYDSRASGNTPLATLTRNQLPPIIEVTMVAIDEKGAARLASEFGNAMPTLGTGNTSLATSFQGSISQFKTELQALEKALTDRRIAYRVFSGEISILQAKWSEN